MELKGLFVRIPAEQAERLDVACARLRTTKQALVSTLIDAQLEDAGAAAPLRGDDDVVLTFDELVELLRVDAAVVRARVEAGEIPGRRFAGEWRFARHAVLGWLAGSDAQPRPAAGFAVTGS